MKQHTVDVTKHGIDASAAAVAGASFMELLPPIAATLSIIWLSIQIGTWAVRTVNSYRDRKSKKKK